MGPAVPEQDEAGLPEPERVLGAATRMSLVLSSDDFAPRAARSFVREVLRDWDLEALLDRAVLITSELVTNACRHGRTRDDAERITLTLARSDGTVAIVVEDNSPRRPLPRRASADALNGRGLRLVEMQADGWTTRLKLDGAGKHVFAFLRCPPTPAPDPQPPAAACRHHSGAVRHAHSVTT